LDWCRTGDAGKGGFGFGRQKQKKESNTAGRLKKIGVLIEMPFDWKFFRVGFSFSLGAIAGLLTLWLISFIIVSVLKWLHCEIWWFWQDVKRKLKK
jgi:hypothetical protein